MPQRGSDRGGRGESQPNPYEYRETKLEPLVPGFGEEDVFTPPLGFGAEAELFTLEVTERDRQEAERAFRSYDRNNDGKITSEEMRRSRYGADLPMYDKNRDGIITMNEMEYRYARRRVENLQETASNQQRRDERSRREEKEEKQFGYQWGDRRSYRKAPIVERLPDGLPEWFGRDDADQDGQIAMMEFSTDWSDSVMADFNQFDLSRDGLITPRECLRAVENGAVRGSPPSSDDSSGNYSSRDDSSASVSDSSASASSPSRDSASPPPANIDPRYFNFAQGMIAKYDTNKDGVLTGNEWANMSRDPSGADADGDGRLTVEELARGLMKR
jgi:Ca2+-binding EF-hand superfamily protein